jgi:hypothetical protein
MTEADALVFCLGTTPSYSRPLTIRANSRYSRLVFCLSPHNPMRLFAIPSLLRSIPTDYPLISSNFLAESGRAFC